MMNTTNSIPTPTAARSALRAHAAAPASILMLGAGHKLGDGHVMGPDPAQCDEARLAIFAADLGVAPREAGEDLEVFRARALVIWNDDDAILRATSAPTLGK